MSSTDSFISIYTGGLAMFPGTQVGSHSGGDMSQLEGTTQLEASLSNPKSFSRLFPSMHTLSSLSSLRDTSRYSGKKTTYFDKDVGIMAHDSAFIGQGAQFDVRRVKMCCDDGFFVLKSALSAAYRKRGQALGKRTGRGGSSFQQDQDEEKRMMLAVLHEYRALSHPPIREHPNIVDILDLGWETDPENRSDKWPVLVLEYADQGTMKDFLAQAKLSLETRTKLCLDVARGLGVIHTSGIVHGDLKMDNVLIFTNKTVSPGSVDRYTAKLADFGASLVGADGKQCPSHSRPWNGPEYLNRLDLEGHKRHDIYSFGLLFWAVILGGRNPFDVVDKVFQRLDSDEWDASVERLKVKNRGKDLLDLARQSFTEAFGHLKAPVGAIENMVQLDPGARDLGKAVDALEGFLEPLRTEEEAKAAKTLPTGELLERGPAVCSHTMIHTQGELQSYQGPLRKYLEQMLQDQAEESGERSNDRMALSLLAELELDDWLEGRSSDPSRILEHYQAIRDLFPFESSTLCSLAAETLPIDQAKEVLMTRHIRNSMVESFTRGYTPSLNHHVKHFSTWASDNICYPLICNNAGVYDPPIPYRVYDTLTKSNSDIGVMSVLRLAFPDKIKALGPDADLNSTILDEDSGNLAIHFLSQVGAAGLLKSLLEMPGIDINPRNSRLETPLLLAARAGRFFAAMLLVEQGAKVFLTNAYKENPLHWLSSFRFTTNSKEMEQFARAVLATGSRDLLRAEAEFRRSGDFPEHDFEGSTPIVRAIIKGFDQAALLLWEMEREAFAPARPDFRAILWAAKLHNHRLLDAFLQGPDDLVHPETGTSLLYFLIDGSRSGTGVGQILRHGASGCRRSGVETIKILAKYGASGHFANPPGLPHCNVLSIAVDYYAPEAVEFLLKEMDCAKFVNVLAVNPSISFATARGEDVKYAVDQWKSSLLYRAMLFDRLRVFDLLLEHGADVNQVLGSEYGPLTMLHHSVILGQDATYTKRLLDTGKITNPDQTADPDFETPFCTAVRLRKFDIADALLSHGGVDINYRFVNGIGWFPVSKVPQTILAWILRQEGSLSSLACVSYLLETGRASPWATDQERNFTVLHALAQPSGSSGSSGPIAPRGVYHEEFVRRAWGLLDGVFRFGDNLDLLNARESDPDPNSLPSSEQKEGENEDTSNTISGQRNGKGTETGRTALEYAVLNYRAILVEKLVLAGADWHASGKGLGSDSAVMLAMKMMYNFPGGVLADENCPPREKQLERALSSLRHICLVLFRKAREGARERAREMKEKGRGRLEMEMEMMHLAEEQILSEDHPQVSR